MTYKEICANMTNAGWGSHAVLCANGITDPGFDRKGTNFCTVGSIKRLDTYALYEHQGRAPDSSEWAGQPATLEWLDPQGGTAAAPKQFQAWIYRDKGLVGFINREGKHLLCALSDVERKLVPKK